MVSPGVSVHCSTRSGEDSRVYCHTHGVCVFLLVTATGCCSGDAVRGVCTIGAVPAVAACACASLSWCSRCVACLHRVTVARRSDTRCSFTASALLWRVPPAPSSALACAALLAAACSTCCQDVDLTGSRGKCASASSAGASCWYMLRATRKASMRAVGACSQPAACQPSTARSTAACHCCFGSALLSSLGSQVDSSVFHFAEVQSSVPL